MRPLTATIVDCFYSLREAREIAAVFFLLAIQFVSALMRYCEFGDDLRKHVHTLVERSERYALIVSMHAFQIILRQRKRYQPVRLHLMQPQMRRIRQPRRLKMHRWHATEFLGYHL